MQPSKQPSQQPSLQPYMCPSSRPSQQPFSRPTKQPSLQPVRKPSRKPSAQPSRGPSDQPSRQPSSQPIKKPTTQPSKQPFSRPSSQPTQQPYFRPSRTPSVQPSVQPTRQPISRPSLQPFRRPTVAPSRQPSSRPSKQPIHYPTRKPTQQPSIQPTSTPTLQPNSKPTIPPSIQPSIHPTYQPSKQPSHMPSFQPTTQPSRCPSGQPSQLPSHQPTQRPSHTPTLQPVDNPSSQPIRQPTHSPTSWPTRQPSGQPYRIPSSSPSLSPTCQPSRQPTAGHPSCAPTMQPSLVPSVLPSEQPYSQPTLQPSQVPSLRPTGYPTSKPSRQPYNENPSQQPTGKPSSEPTLRPSVQPSLQPRVFPSNSPTLEPTIQPTSLPSNVPSGRPSESPSQFPSSQPICRPSTFPTLFPSSQPSSHPSLQATLEPTCQPTKQPSTLPSVQPKSVPSLQPVICPSSFPSESPSQQPSNMPSLQPLADPTCEPTNMPSVKPSAQPSNAPSRQPDILPSSIPSSQPKLLPSSEPTCSPSLQPSSVPTTLPTLQKTENPTSQPSQNPSGKPTLLPTETPSRQPTRSPTRLPSSLPSRQPSSNPTNPSSPPTAQPTGSPITSHPSSITTSQPTISPSVFPSTQPSRRPTKQPSIVPSCIPSTQPFDLPTRAPTKQPYSNPSLQPSITPSAFPTMCPSFSPTHKPSLQPDNRPSAQPHGIPSSQPATLPTLQPSKQPSSQPRMRPTHFPSASPSISPSKQPLRKPTRQPSKQPSRQPSKTPTRFPSSRPSLMPINRPTHQPITRPTIQPTNIPSNRPSFAPTEIPISRPSFQPVCLPSSVPTLQPTLSPTSYPTRQPSKQPSVQPLVFPTRQPTEQPQHHPSNSPSSYPTFSPSRQPAKVPSNQPSRQPVSRPTIQPVLSPTEQPSKQPFRKPTCQPSNNPIRNPSRQPIAQPSSAPTSQPLLIPTTQPSSRPSLIPSNQPTTSPTGGPSIQPSPVPSSDPSLQPSQMPTIQPSMKPDPSPSGWPSGIPSTQPTEIPLRYPSSCPTLEPSSQPSRGPSSDPTEQPLRVPSQIPTCYPSCQPSNFPTSLPTNLPTVIPSSIPCLNPTIRPSSRPSFFPTTQPTSWPSSSPSNIPSSLPSLQPSSYPRDNPTNEPSIEPTINPSGQPSISPNHKPTQIPVSFPTKQPRNLPTTQPSRQPRRSPSRQPVKHPTAQPSRQPSKQPSVRPSRQPYRRPRFDFPTGSPTNQPTKNPNRRPSSMPSKLPTSEPSIFPSSVPSYEPSRLPTLAPSVIPTLMPKSVPTRIPSSFPTSYPYTVPTTVPSGFPTMRPSCIPSTFPTTIPSFQPVMHPSLLPSLNPTTQPSKQPNFRPLRLPTNQPTHQPSAQPTKQPMKSPSRQPYLNPTRQPSKHPTSQPSLSPSASPSYQPLKSPSCQPSHIPSLQPSQQPFRRPSKQPTRQPVKKPSRQPTSNPSKQPSKQPSRQPSRQPTKIPTRQPTRQPSKQPSKQPIQLPSSVPTRQPRIFPSSQPLIFPSTMPSGKPTKLPSNSPSFSPSGNPSSQPTAVPSIDPISIPTNQPSAHPSSQSSAEPSRSPSNQPSKKPLVSPTHQPISWPSAAPTTQPRVFPTKQPSKFPTCQPSKSPSRQPSKQPLRKPSKQPVIWPTRQPTQQPMACPTIQPTLQPRRKPTCQPVSMPTSQPSSQPLKNPTEQPLAFPSRSPTRQPMTAPSSNPTKQPMSRPSRQPIRKPTSQPSQMPTHPSTNPSIQPVRVPSKTPTETPSDQPSPTPTRQPSKQPMRVPSSQPSLQPFETPVTSCPTTSNPLFLTVPRSPRPTRKPTELPTSMPTSTPSVSPSISFISAWYGALEKYYGDLLRARTVNTTELYYSEFIYQGVVVDGFSQFDSFVFGPLKLASASRAVRGIGLQNFTDLNDLSIEQGSFCYNQSLASKIVQRLVNFRVDSSAMTIQCDNRRWVIENCPSEIMPKLCLDCSNPCLSPLNTAISVSCTMRGYCYNNLIVYFEESLAPPQIQEITPLIQSYSSLSVIARVESFVYIYCIAQEASLPPPSIAQILAGKPSRGNANISITFDGLTAISHYNISCLSQSVSGQLAVSPSFVTLSTMCCKHVEVTLLTQVIVPNEYYQQFASISLSASPSRDLSIALNSSSYYSSCSFSPFLTFDYQGGLGTYYIGARCDLSVRMDSLHGLQVHLDGQSAEEYIVKFTRGDSFQVVSSGYIGRAPSFSSASLSSNGIEILLNFTSNTNRAFLTSTFECSSLLSFPGVDLSFCQWLDDASIRIVTGSSRAVLNIGDSITLSVQSLAVENIINLKEQCPVGFSCKYWPSISIRESIAIKGPKNPIRPKILVNGPSTIFQKNELTLDLTGSTGHCGRPWTTAEVEVRFYSVDDLIANNSRSVQSLTVSQLRANNYNFATYPPNTFHSGATYSLHFTLCNWLARCGEAIYFLTVTNYTLPIAKIVGFPTRNVKVYESITLYTFIEASQSVNVSIRWQVSQHGVVVPNVINKCNDSNVFCFEEFSLKSGQEYEITLTVTDYFISAASSSSLTIVVDDVRAEDIVAKISQGDFVTVKIGEAFTLDGSTSYDRAYSASRGEVDPQLRYSWSCQVLLGPMNQSFCPLLFPSSVSNSPYLNITWQLPTTVSIMLVTLMVHKDDRVNQASIRLLANSTGACYAAVLNPTVGVMTVNKKLKVVAWTRAMEPNTRYVWSIEDTFGKNIVQVVSGTEFARNIASIQPLSTFSLVIQANSLSMHSKYDIQLSCYHADSLSSYSSVTIHTNSPPVPGEFSVEPLTGREYSTPFLMTALYWSSEELPLLYSFGYLSITANDSALSIRSKSEGASTRTVLPGGEESQNYTLTLSLSVSDILDGLSNRYRKIKVLHTNDSTVFQSNVDLQSIGPLGLYVSSLNRVNCTQTPNCSALNRNPCGKVDHTCGNCVEGFLGLAGDSNTFCFTAADMRMRKLTMHSCNSSSTCSSYQYCHNQVCKALNKTCLNSCSNHGGCEWYNVNSGYSVTSCEEDDLTCAGRCVCAPGWYGRDCAETLISFSARISFRRSAVLSFHQLILIGTIDSSLLRDWIALSTSISFKFQEFDSATLLDFIASVERILTLAEELQLPFEDLLPMAIPLDNLLSTSNYFNSTSDTSDHIYSLNALIKRWIGTMSHDLELTQSLMTIQSNFRSYLVTAVTSGNTSLLEPLTPAEVALSARSPTTVVVAFNATFERVLNEWSKFGVIVYKASAVGTDLNSNPVSFVADEQTLNLNSLSVSFIAPNIEAIDTKTFEGSLIETQCRKGETTRRRYSCSGGLVNVSVECLGAAERVISYCPAYAEKSTCVRISTVHLERKALVPSYETRDAEHSFCKFKGMFLTNSSFFVSVNGLQLTTSSTPDSIRVAEEAEVPFPVNLALLTICLGLVIIALVRFHPILRFELKQKMKMAGKKKISPNSIIPKLFSWTTERDSFPSEAYIRSSSIDYQYSNPQAIQSLRTVAREVVPPVFLEGSMTHHIYQVLSLHHRYCPLQEASKTSTSAFIGILAANVFFFIFVATLTITERLARRECRHLYSRDSCALPKFSFGSDERSCRWNTSLLLCEHSSPQRALSIAMLVLICQIVSVPVVLIIEALLRKEYERYLLFSSSSENDEDIPPDDRKAEDEGEIVAEISAPNLKQELDYFKKLSTIDRRECLIHWFVEESLSNVSSAIYKSYRERLRPKPLDRRCTRVSFSTSLGTIILGNVLLLCVSAVLASTSTTETQVLLSKGFCCWIVLEPLCSQTLFLVVTMVLLPISVRLNILQCVQQWRYRKEGVEREKSHILSTIAARLYPQLRESRLVLQVDSMPIVAEERATGLFSLFSSFYLKLPVYVQDMLLYLLLTVTVGGTFICVIVLVEENVILICVPIIFLIMVVSSTYLFSDDAIPTEPDSYSINSLDVIDLVDIGQLVRIQSSELLDLSSPSFQTLLKEDTTVPPNAETPHPREEADDHIRTIASAEELYQSALTTGISTAMGRSLMFRSGMQAIEAGLYSIARERIGRSLFQIDSSSRLIADDASMGRQIVVRNRRDSKSRKQEVNDFSISFDEGDSTSAKGEDVVASLSFSPLDFLSDLEDSESSDESDDKSVYFEEGKDVHFEDKKMDGMLDRFKSILRDDGDDYDNEDDDDNISEIEDTSPVMIESSSFTSPIENTFLRDRGVETASQSTVKRAVDASNKTSVGNVIADDSIHRLHSNADFSTLILDSIVGNSIEDIDISSSSSGDNSSELDSLFFSSYGNEQIK